MLALTLQGKQVNKVMKKVLLYFMLMLLPSCVMAQNSRGRVNPSIYLTGAVPVVNGYVQFDKTYYVKNKSKAALMDSLRNYVQRELVDGEEQLPQARITEVSPDSGIIAASIEEYMY